MSAEQGIVRVPDPSAAGTVRAGLVLADEGESYRVRWDDTGTDEVVPRSGDVHVMPRRSLRFLALSDPALFHATFAAEPMTILLHALAESPGPLKVGQIREYVVGLGLEKEAWLESGPKTLEVLPKRAGVVRKQVGGTRAYTWEGDDLPDLPSAATGPAGEDEKATAAEITGPEPQAAQDESAQDNRASPASGAESRPSDSEPTLAELIEAGAGQLDGAERTSPEQAVAFAELLRRCAAAGDDLPPPVLPELVRIAAAVASDGDTHLDAVEKVSEQVARLLRRPGASPQARVDLDALAEITGRLPLTTRGGRVALLQAIDEVWPERVAESRWWRDVSLAVLADAACGALGGVTSKVEVAEQVIRPLMLREVTAATTFTQLARLLTLPREFASQVPPEVVASAFRRVAGEDRLVSAWLHALTASGRIAELEEELAKARTAVAAAEQTAAAAQRRGDEFAERCSALEHMLRSEHTESVRLRSAQDRQVRIDTVRTLAELAAEVEEQTANNMAPQEIVRRVRDLVAAVDLHPIETAGEESVFDPSLHDPIVGSPESGVPVTVIRPGYRWRADGEDVLLDKALVTTT